MKTQRTSRKNSKNNDLGLTGREFRKALFSLHTLHVASRNEDAAQDAQKTLTEGK